MSKKPLSVDFAELAKEVAKEHNNIRTNPQSYVPVLEKYLTYFKENILYRPNETPIQTHEGITAVEEALEFLKKATPVEALTFDENLTKACQDHIDDIGPKGVTSHEGSDNSTVTDRIEKHSEWDTACAENIDFGSKNAQDIIASLVIDDGVPSRGHRRNLFSQSLKFFGVASGAHKEYDILTVIDYVGGLRQLNKPFFDYKNYKFDYEQFKKTQENKKKPKTNPFQQDDEDAPEDTVSVKINKLVKDLEGEKKLKITRKIYTLKDGTQHIVEIEDVN